MIISTEELAIIDRASGASRELPFGDISLSGNTIVKVPASHTSVRSARQLGNDLVLQFTDGNTLNIQNFFAADDNQVVFEDGSSLWLGQYDAGLTALQFTELTSLDALLLVPAASAGVSWLAIGLGATGVAALAAAAGGSGGDDNVVGTPPVVLQPLSDLAVNATGTTLTGRGQPGFTIRVRNAAGEVIATGTVAADGSFSIALSPAQISGASLNVTQSSSTGAESASLTVGTPDLTAPEAVVNLQVGSNGSVLTGEGEPGAVVTVRNAAGDIIGTGTVGQNGQFSITLAPAQIDGTALSVTLTDGAGNVSQAAMVASPDLTPPAAASDLQVSSNGSVISGRGDPGSVVTVRNQAGDIVGIGMVNIDGSFSINLSPAQADGAALSVTLTDAAGNMSSVSAVNTPDLTPPAAPSALVVSNDGTVLTGRGEAGAAVTVRDAAGDIVGSGTVAADGSFSIVLSPPQVEGSQLNVVLTGSNGNTSESVVVQSPDLVMLQTPTNVTVQANGTMVQGSAQPAGAEVMVYNADNQMVGWGMVNPDGSFTVMLNPPQNDGRALRLSLRMGDQYSAPVWSDTPDTTPPAAPDNLQLSADGTTLSGSGAAGSAVTIRNSAGVIVGTGQVAANGLFTVNLTTAQTDGSSLQVTLTDTAGNQSTATVVGSPDLTAPPMPVSLQVINNGQKLIGSGEPGAVVRVLNVNNELLGIGVVLPNGSFSINLTPAQTDGATLQITLTDAAGNTSVAGSINSPDLTPPAMPQQVQMNAQGTALSGTGEVGATVKVLNAAGLVVGSGTVQADGSFSITLNPPQIDGGQLSVVLRDAAGNTSTAATVQSPDLVEIATPVNLSVSMDGTVLTGEGTSGMQVQVWNAAGELVGSGVVQGDGSFSITLTPAQQDGGTLQAVLNDGAGKYSAPGLVGTYDNTAPDAPVNLQVSADGSSVSGSGEAGATVTVRNAANQIVGSGIVQADGSFSVTLTPAQTDGSTLSVSLTDAAGNTSQPANVIAQDLIAPDLPVNLQISANGAVITGAGEPGAIVKIYNSLNHQVGTGVVQADGNFSIALNLVQNDGSPLRITLTDSSGNISSAAVINSPDLIAPNIPLNLQVNADGSILTGTGEPGAEVTVRNVINEIIGTTVVQPDGSFSVEMTPVQNSGGLLSVILTDSAGNSSLAIAVAAPDLVAPDMPANLQINATGNIISGAGEAGAAVVVYNTANQVVGTGTVLPNGSFSINLTPAQTDGAALQITLTDVAGNTSVAGSINSPDLTPPAMPQQVQMNAQGTALSGTGEVGATVKVLNAAGLVVGSGTVQADGSFSITLNPPQIDGGQLSVVLRDAAGNTSTAATVQSPDLVEIATPVNLSVSMDGTVLTGEGTSGMQVQVWNAAGELVGSGVVQGDGSFSITLTPAQQDGGTLQAVLNDGAGKYSAPGLVGTYDNTAPDAPVNLQVSADGSSVSGSGEAGATVTVRNAANQIVGSGIVQADGSFSITLTPAQTDGSTLSVSLTDAAGNTSLAANVYSPDLQAPAMPDNLGVSADGLTLSGTGEPGAAVTVRNMANQIIGTGTVQADGSFSIALTPAQIDGSSLSVTLTDAAGNTSVAGHVNSLDLVAPAIPQNLQIAADGTQITGTGEAGATVTVRDDTNTVIGSGIVAQDGSFTIILTPAQQDGGLLTIILTDSANNSSDNGWLSSPDLIAPEIPLNLNINAAGTLVSGQGELGALVRIYNAAGDLVGSGLVGPDGSFAVVLVPAQGDSGVLSVTLTDAAENESAAGLLTAPDLIPPSAPANLVINAVGSSLTGSGEVNATVTVRNAANQVVGTGTVQGDGSFSITLAPQQNDGGQLSITLTDSAGNVSAASQLASPDLIAPDMPLALQVSNDGSSLTGVGEVGSVVTVRNAANQIVGTSTVQADGSFTISLTPVQGDSGVLHVTLTDAAGNTSVAGNVSAPDLIAPDIPVNLQISADGVTVTGEGEVGAIVRIYNSNNLQIGSGLVQADGSFSITLNLVQNDGSSLRVTQTDAAGNISAAAIIASPDLTAPDAPLNLQLNADGSILTGTGEPGASVTVRNTLNAVVGTGTVLADGSFSISLVPVQNNGGNLNVVLTDNAGNTSGSGTVNAPDLVAPDMPANLQISVNGSILSGTGEAGAGITVRNAANQIVGSGTVQPDGSFTLSLSPAQSDGGVLSITLTDAAGNTSVAGNIASPDLIAPDLPLNLQVNAAGTLLSGTGEVGAGVIVRNAANQVVGTGTVLGDGSFSVTLSPAQTDGLPLNITLTDIAGNTSVAATINSPDLLAPDIPFNLQVNASGTMLSGRGEAGTTVTVRNAVNDIIGTGTVLADGSFNIVLTVVQGDSGLLSVTLTDAAGNTSLAGTVSAPDLIPPAMPLALQVNAEGTGITGTGEIGAVVTVRNATNHIVGSGVVQGDGSFSITLNPPQIDGGELSITLTDAAGNVSAAGSATAPDLIEIATPVNLAMNGAGTELTGEGEAGTIVTVWNEDGQQVGSGVVLPDGTFSVALLPAQIDGRSLEVVLSDGAGKYSAAGLIYSPDLTAPDAATDLQVSADGSVLTGTGEVGAVVEVRNVANQLVGTGTIQPDGSFSIALTPLQRDGSVLQITLTDAAGNTSVVANVSTPDLIAPPAPANLQVNADGLSLTGTGEAGATVTVRNAANQIIGTATVQGDGSFTVVLSPAQNDGSLLQVRQTDPAGNISAAGSVLSPDLVAPLVPVNLQVAADGLSVSGNGEAGATVTVRNALNQIVGTGLVQPDGSFIISLLAVQGDSGLLTVTLTDAAGNTSVAANVNAPDLIPPAVADNLSINAPGTQLTGEGEPGATVTVYNAAAEVVGSGIVAANGTFTIVLNPAQDNGGLLSVVLADSSGNLSAAAQIAAPVVVDIAAYDNAATAKVNILPTETHSATGNAAYTLLLGLLGAINLQVLATPSIGFTVADGSEGQITLTLGTALAIEALGDHRIVLQMKQGNQWVAVSGAGQASFLSVSLLAGNAKGVIVEGLATGEYRAFVAINALVGLSVATTLSGALMQADYSNPVGYDDIAASGNVLTDLNDASQQDLITVNTVVSQVNQTVVAAAGNTVIQGQYGQLTIDAAGNYSYTPDANVTVIGKAEQFQYRITDTATGRQSTATLYVRIDSDQVDLVWGAPGDNAELVLSAGNNSAVAAVVYKNVMDAPVTNLLGTFSTPGAILLNPGKGNAQLTFQVDANDVSNIIIYAGTSLALAVLPSYSVVLEKSNGAGGWVAVPGGSVSGTALLGLPLVGTGVSLSLNGLTGGTYRITVNTTNTIGGSFLSSVQLVQTLTHLDKYTVDTNPGVSGNILADDVLGSSFTKLFVKGSSGLYQEVNYAGINITGSYGVLHINKHGNYVYTPNGSQHHTAGVTELFEYQLRHPSGQIITARLEIRLDVAGAGVLSGSAVLQSDGEEAVALLADDPQLYQQPELFHKGWSPDFDLLRGKVHHTAEVVTELDLHLSQLLDTGQDIQLRSTEVSKVALTADNWQVTTDMHNLRLLAEQDYYQQHNISVV
ncbi:VCBS repeat-containing protein [Rheinheimera pacifica]|uniref:BapA/Bap/LapF family large adhesin n=1 Tax=Rheinheimera pacifica TaxID=173990 RepID=UPI00216750C7|nr:BapA/Bap/LapF family large adhesin [Rheinheimera pacifica]MCS4305871.1 VCBS repeat-containing protein [Rheinheimera pacifica]